MCVCICVWANFNNELKNFLYRSDCEARVLWGSTLIRNRIKICMYVYVYLCVCAYIRMYACTCIWIFVLPLIKFATHSSGRIWKNGVLEQKLTHSHHWLTHIHTSSHPHTQHTLLVCDNALSHLFHFYVNLARKSYQNSKMFSRGSGPRERQRRRTSICTYVGALRFVAKFRSCSTHTHRPKIVGDPERQFSFKSKNFNELWKTLKISKGKKKKKPIHKTKTTRNRTAMTNT